MPEKDPNPGPENDLDPGANTQMFQAFVERHETEDAPSSPSRGVLIGVIAAVVVVVAVLGWLVFG